MGSPELPSSAALDVTDNLNAMKITAEISKAEAEAAKADVERKRSEAKLREYLKPFWRTRSFATSTLIPVATVLTALVAFYSTVLSNKRDELRNQIEQANSRIAEAKLQVAEADQRASEARLIESAALARASLAETRAQQAEETGRQLHDARAELLSQIKQSKDDLVTLQSNYAKQKNDLEEQALLAPAEMHLKSLREYFENYPNYSEVSDTSASNFLVAQIAASKNQDKLVKYLLDNSKDTDPNMGAATKYAWTVAIYEILYRGTSNPEWLQQAHSVMLSNARAQAFALFGAPGNSSGQIQVDEPSEIDLNLTFQLLQEFSFEDRVEFLHYVWEAATRQSDLSFDGNLTFRGRFHENAFYRIAAMFPNEGQRFPPVYLAALKYFQNRWLNATTPDDLNYYGGSVQVLSPQCWALTIIMNYSNEKWQRAIDPYVVPDNWATGGMPPEIVQLLKSRHDKKTFVPALIRWLDTSRYTDLKDNRELVGEIWVPFNPKFFISADDNWWLTRLFERQWIGH